MLRAHLIWKFQVLGVGFPTRGPCPSGTLSRRADLRADSALLEGSCAAWCMKAVNTQAFSGDATVWAPWRVRLALPVLLPKPRGSRIPPRHRQGDVRVNVCRSRANQKTTRTTQLCPRLRRLARLGAVVLQRARLRDAGRTIVCKLPLWRQLRSLRCRIR